MRRPRAGDERSSRTRAAPGLRPGILRSPARSSLTAGPARPVRYRDGAVTRKAPRSPGRGGAKRFPEKRGPAPKGERCDGAPRGATCRKRYVTTTHDAPLGAPSPRYFEGRGTGRRPNRGPQRIRAVWRARSLAMPASGRGIRTNRELLYELLFGYIRALFRSG